MSQSLSAVGRRVVVTGLAGSGKSTFADALAARTGLPVVRLDLSFWKPGWVAPSESEWREKQRDVLAGDAWIADGNYRETLDLRLERADTVVVLDMPWWRCSGRALRRGFQMPDALPEGCDYPRWMRLRDEWGLAVRIWQQRRVEPERERAVISQHGRHAALHVLRSEQAVSDFLDGVDDTAVMDAQIDVLDAGDPLLETVLHWHWREWSLGTEAERDVWRERLAARTGATGIPFTLVARWGDEPVGSISVCTDDVDDEFADRGPWLTGVFVLGAARNLGLGRRLLDVAADRARQAGATELWLHTGEATHFYERCGYSVARPKTSLEQDAVLWRTLD